MRIRALGGPLLLAAALSWAGCDGGGDGGGWRTVCDGQVCSQQVATAAEYEALSKQVSTSGAVRRYTKYMVPAVEDYALIPPLAQNLNLFPDHLIFLKTNFLPSLTAQDYMGLVLQRATRQYYAGNLMRLADPERGEFSAFTAYTESTSVEALEPAEVRWILGLLGQVFTVEELVFTFDPTDAIGPNKARAWVDPGFDIYFPDQSQVDVEVYTPAVNYGRVKLYTLAEFEAATAAGLIGYRDIPVIDAVPFDIEAVVAGVITGGRQWELSHVNVRLGRRGTPNAYVREALSALAAWDGALVRLETCRRCDAPGQRDQVRLTAAEPAEAEAWWEAHRPRLEDVPPADRNFIALLRLTEMDVDDVPVRLVSRVGGKVANLAKLFAFLEPGYQVPGLGIPLAHFEAFQDATLIEDRRLDPPEEVSLREYVRRLAADPEVAADAAYRRGLLWDLRSRLLSRGRVPRELVEALAIRIREVFGAPGGISPMVRFRSSSNIEDGLEFSGAGLYTSTSVCAADSEDDDLLGPSACDPDSGGEHSIELGLLTVWASLFNDRAWEERDWYQVPQEAASMGILVTLAFPDELANGVAFTGDPSNPAETRYLVNAQFGDEKVVGNDACLVPEKDMLEIVDGEVRRIYRVRSSVLAPPGEKVLSDAQLGELGALMAGVEAQYPLELGSHAREEVLLDLEFKIDTQQKLRIKQIRPFLLNEPAP